MEIDWDEIAAKFGKIAEALHGFELLDREEFEQYRLSCLTYGLVKAPNWIKVEYGAAIYVYPKRDTFTRDAWIGLAEEVGAKRGASMRPPAYLSGSNVDHFAVVAAAISSRSPTQEFLRSWARLHELSTLFGLLSLSSEASGELLRQAIDGEMGGVEIQRHWYAHWVLRNAPDLARDARIDAEQALGILCAEIARGERPPWGRYPVEWYRRVLGEAWKAQKPETDDVGSNFSKLGARRLRELAAHPILTPAALPPLSPQEFPS